jgi:NADPH:quinone reductase-like Zn-dependent oxidoreductase
MPTMRAVVLDAPGPAESLTIRELPVPTPAPGWVLIRVTAFGLNRSELHTRLGLAKGVTFPPGARYRGRRSRRRLMEHGSAGGKLVVVP